MKTEVKSFDLDLDALLGINPKTFKKYGFTYVMINAIKQLYFNLLKVETNVTHQERHIAAISDENEKLKLENARQNKELSELKHRLDEIEKRLNSK